MPPRSRRRTLLPLVATGALLASFAVSPSAANAGRKVVTRIGTADVEANFTTPPAEPSDTTILDEVVRLIDATPAGETIQMAIYSITANYVYRAIARAKARGV